jgi:hypothetical protein
VDAVGSSLRAGRVGVLIAGTSSIWMVCGCNVGGSSPPSPLSLRGEGEPEESSPPAPSPARAFRRERGAAAARPARVVYDIRRERVIPKRGGAIGYTAGGGAA